jgi:hypothetical protein
MIRAWRHGMMAGASASSGVPSGGTPASSAARAAAAAGSLRGGRGWRGCSTWSPAWCGNQESIVAATRNCCGVGSLSAGVAKFGGGGTAGTKYASALETDGGT